MRAITRCSRNSSYGADDFAIVLPGDSQDKALSSGPNDWHFNEEGNRRAMQALAGILMQRKLVPQGMD